MKTSQNKELFIIDIAEDKNVEVQLNGYSREVNAQIYITQNNVESTTLTVIVGNELHQLFEHTQTLDKPIDELCLLPIVDGEYLSVRVSDTDTAVQIKNQQDEKGIIIDIFDSKGDFVESLGYLTEDDILENKKVA